jgi:type IV pilus assembly protein PilA
MLARLRKRYEDDAESGFTLIELLVVMVIIGILAAIAIPTFLNQKGKAYDSAAKSAIRTLSTAEESYATNSNAGYTGDAFALKLATTDKDATVWAQIVSADTNGYCVEAFDSRAATPTVYFWDSQQGGQLSDSSKACTSGGTWVTDPSKVATKGTAAPGVPKATTAAATWF